MLFNEPFVNNDPNHDHNYFQKTTLIFYVLYKSYCLFSYLGAYL